MHCSICECVPLMDDFTIMWYDAVSNILTSSYHHTHQYNADKILEDAKQLVGDV